MIKTIEKNDIFFAVMMFFGLIIILFSFFLYPITDETFYPTVALRLVNGDSLIQDEWHFSQFSSIFNFLPVLLFVKITGTVEGIILYLRVIYLFIHCTAAIISYRIFRSKGLVAVFAVAVFFVPFYMLTVSYHTVGVISLFFLTLCVYSVYLKKQKILYAVIGVFYGICCICNPLICFCYLLYVIAFLTFRLKNKNRATDSTMQSTQLSGLQSCFFDKTSFIFISSGIILTALAAFLFFVFTGGSFSSLLENIKMMFSVSEYSIDLLTRIDNIYSVYEKLNFRLPFLLPVLFVVLMCDKKRQNILNRFVYMFFSFLIFCMLVIRILTSVSLGIFAVLLPFTMFSSVCYILTRNKNKPLFYCIWLPGVIGAIFQLISSRATFMVFGAAVIPSAFAGVFILSDILLEIKYDIEEVTKKNRKVKKTIVRDSKFILRTEIINKVSFAIVCLVFGVHCIFQLYTALFYYDWYGIPSVSYPESVCVASGPMKGTYMLPEYHNEYLRIMDDIDYIKEHSEESDPVLILSYYPWLYLYSERPCASYSAWGEIVNIPALQEYYSNNPKKTPKFIYITNKSYSSIKEEDLRKLFYTGKTILSEGVLLTVKN